MGFTPSFSDLTRKLAQLPRSEGRFALICNTAASSGQELPYPLGRGSSQGPPACSPRCSFLPF